MTTNINELFSLAGRTAIVTGGTRGIGLAIAHGYGAAGANVVVASRKAEACQAAAAELAAAGVEAIGVPTHTGDLASIEALIAATSERFGGIDIVVNNAATAIAQPFGRFTTEAYDKIFDVNLKGPVFLTQAALPHLIESDHAAVIHVISAASFMTTPYTSLYGATKTALLSFTRSMAAELAAHGIRVNALAPGTVDTQMVRNNPAEVQESMAKASHMGRAGQPQEMVGPALFLASDAASFVTGQAIIADGGLVPAR